MVRQLATPKTNYAVRLITIKPIKKPPISVALSKTLAKIYKNTKYEPNIHNIIKPKTSASSIIMNTAIAKKLFRYIQIYAGYGQFMVAASLEWLLFLKVPLGMWNT